MYTTEDLKNSEKEEDNRARTWIDKSGIIHVLSYRDEEEEDETFG